MKKKILMMSFAMLALACHQNKNPLLDLLNKNSESIHTQIQWLRYSIHKLDVIKESQRVNLSQIVDEVRDKTEPFYSRCDSAMLQKKTQYSKKLISEYKVLFTFMSSLYNRYEKVYDSLEYTLITDANPIELISAIKNKLLSAERELLSRIAGYETHNSEITFRGASLDDTAFFDGKVHKIKVKGTPTHQRDAFPFFEVTKVTKNGELITYPKVISDITYGYIILDSLPAGTYELQYLFGTKRGLFFDKPQTHNFYVK